MSYCLAEAYQCFRGMGSLCLQVTIKIGLVFPLRMSLNSPYNQADWCSSNDPYWYLGGI